MLLLRKKLVGIVKLERAVARHTRCMVQQSVFGRQGTGTRPKHSRKGSPSYGGIGLEGCPGSQRIRKGGSDLQSDLTSTPRSPAFFEEVGMAVPRPDGTCVQFQAVKPCYLDEKLDPNI